MSAFLGSIHHWVFNKIQFQNKIVNTLIEFSNKNNLILDLDGYPKLEQGKLENIIDESNIHGWLQERVSLVEDYLACIVTTIINKDDSALTNLKEIFFKIGKDNKVEKENSVKEAFNHLNNILLDGMPCDRVNEIISENETEIIWRRNICVHSQYWEKVNGDVKNYYILREYFIKDMLDETELIFEKINDDTYKLGRQADV